MPPQAPRWSCFGGFFRVGTGGRAIPLFADKPASARLALVRPSVGSPKVDEAGSFCKSSEAGILPKRAKGRQPPEIRSDEASFVESIVKNLECPVQVAQRCIEIEGDIAGHAFTLDCLVDRGQSGLSVFGRGVSPSSQVVLNHSPECTCILRYSRDHPFGSAVNIVLLRVE